MARSAEQLHNSDIERKHVILIVEDEIVVRSLIAAYLRDSDFTVVEAANADEARAILNSQATVHVVFTDFDMPGEMSGIELAGWIHNNHSDIPVLITTGVSDMFNIAEINSPKYFVHKPYIFGDIERRILEFLQDS